jgi:AcrR family transcriptional regulator
MARVADPKLPELILEKAGQLFTKYGFKKTTLEDIASSCDIAVGTLYLYYRNKEHILLEIHERNAVRFVQSLKDRIQEIESPLAKLKTLLMQRTENVWDLMAEGSHAHEVMPLLEERWRSQDERCQPYLAFNTMLCEILEEGVKVGLFSCSQDLNVLADHINLTTAGYLPPSHWVRTKTEAQLHCQIFIDILIHSIMRGKDD